MAIVLTKEIITRVRNIIFVYKYITDTPIIEESAEQFEMDM